MEDDVVFGCAMGEGEVGACLKDRLENGDAISVLEEHFEQKVMFAIPKSDGISIEGHVPS